MAESSINLATNLPMSVTMSYNAQSYNELTYCDHYEESQHHAQHDVQVIGQSSCPQRTQDGGQTPDRASDTLAETFITKN